MDRDLEIIFRATSTEQASILRNVLEDEGIDAVVMNVALIAPTGFPTGGLNSSPCVLVRKDEVPAASAVAQQFEQDISQPLPHDSEPDTDFDGEEEESGDEFERENTWGLCPECEAPRRGQCPHCQAFDTHFPPAEFLLTDRVEHREEDGVSESFEVVSPDDHFMCSVCDTAVSPQPVRFCDRCDHDFGDGLEIIHVPTTMPNGRIVVAFGILGLVAVGGFIYLWLIVN